MRLRSVVIVAFVLVSLGANIIPLKAINEYNSGDSPSWPEFSGTAGDNNWYISKVIVTFNGTVDSTWFKIDGGDFILYSEPFVVQTDGVHLLEWTCDANLSTIYSTEIKIDQTPPIISDYLGERMGLKKWQFTVIASDDCSGMNRVEMYILCGELMGVDYEPPFQCIWRGNMLFIRIWAFLGFWWYGPDALAFDNAGNGAMWTPFT